MPEPFFTLTQPPFLSATIELARRKVAFAGVNVPTKMAAGAKSGAMLSAIVEWKICRRRPCGRSRHRTSPPTRFRWRAVGQRHVPQAPQPAATFPGVLPWIVLLSMVTCVLKNAYTPPPSVICVVLPRTVLSTRTSRLPSPL